VAITGEFNMKIKGIGLPFSVHQSSCSSMSPEKFTWTEDDADIEVWMDNDIPDAIRVPLEEGKKRYAWICESRAIVPQLRQAFKQEKLFKDIIDSYDAIFTCEQELIEKHDKIHFSFAGSNLPWVNDKKYKIHEKTKTISFIASSKNMCKGHELRHRLFEKIKGQPLSVQTSAFGVDVHGSITGKCFGYKPGCHIKGYTENEWHDKLQALEDYMFSVVIENDLYDTYFTEKLTDCFATGTIPVYWGTRRVGDYFNTDGIIFIDDNIESVYNKLKELTPEVYRSRLDAIEDNFERVKNMMTADDMLYDNIRKLN